MPLWILTSERFQPIYFCAATPDEAQQEAAKKLSLEELVWEAESATQFVAPYQYNQLRRTRLFLQQAFAPYPAHYIPNGFLWAYAEGQLLTLAARYLQKLEAHHADHVIGDGKAPQHKWIVAARLTEAIRTEIRRAGGYDWQFGLPATQPGLYYAYVEAQERDKGFVYILNDWSGDRDIITNALMQPITRPDLLWREIVED